MSATLATGASPSAASVTGLITGALAPFAAGRHSPPTKSPNCSYMSVDLRNLHGAAFRDRFHRRFGERQRAPPVLETDRPAAACVSTASTKASISASNASR